MESINEIGAVMEDWEQKYKRFKHYHTPYSIVVLALVAAPLGILITLGAEGAPNNFQFRILAGAIFFGSMIPAYVLNEKSKPFKVPFEKKLAIFAFRAYNALEHSSGDAEGRKEPIRAIGKITSIINDRWPITKKELEDFDLVVHPIVKFYTLLENSLSPVIDRGQPDDLKNAKDYLFDITKYFLQPEPQLINTILEFARPIEILKEEPRKPRIILEKEWLKHVIAYAGSLGAGILTFYVIAPYSERLLETLGFAAVVTFGIAGIYTQFIVKGKG